MVFRQKHDERVDVVLGELIKSRWTPVYVALFWLSGYLTGYYVGDVLHAIGQMF